MIKGREWGWLWIAPGALCTGTSEHVYSTRHIDSVHETSSCTMWLQASNKSVRSPSSPKKWCLASITLEFGCNFTCFWHRRVQIGQFWIGAWITEVSFRSGNSQLRVEHDNNEWLMLWQPLAHMKATNQQAFHSLAAWSEEVRKAVVLRCKLPLVG